MKLTVPPAQFILVLVCQLQSVAGQNMACWPPNGECRLRTRSVPYATFVGGSTASASIQNCLLRPHSKRQTLNHFNAWPAECASQLGRWAFVHFIALQLSTALQY